nr:exodeoxyribonuclease VII large subunit [Micrococcus sp. HSID17245]
MLARPHVMVDSRQEEMDRWRERGRSALGHRLVREEDALTQLRARVRALSPQRTLDRGYAVVQHAGQVVREADQVATDDRLDILVAAGRIAADVVATHRTTPTPSHERTRQA